MPSLSKASLQEISADASAKPVPGTEIALQFNPQSLKLDLANKVEGGDTRGRQQRQYLGKTSTTLSFDLHFDTADAGTTDAPVSVRTLTAMVERFVLPKGRGNDKQAPPKCRFHWNELVLDGVIESVNIDFELFAANGTPLRAKMGVTIKEQDAKYELLQAGPGANNANSATPPGRPGTGPGSQGAGAGPVDRSAQALGGESAADFAARMGLDPGAWRGIAAQLGGGASLSLSAGASIGFSASLSASAGLGVAAGVDLGAAASVEASFGLGGNAGTSAVATGSASPGRGDAGFALAAAGGLGAALASVATHHADAAASNARRAFGAAVPGASAALASQASVPKPVLPAQPRTPVRLTNAAGAQGGAAAPARAAAAPAPPPPKADARASSFGFGVPLRPRATPVPPLAAADPSAPPWLQSAGGAGRSAADRVQARRLPRKPCGCGSR